MIAHTPTLFACVALVATIMAFCLILVGQFNQRDGLLTIGFGLLAHALAYIGYTFYGHAPLWLTYGSANTLLAVALSFYGASVFRVVELPVAWWRVFAPAALMLVLMVTLIDTLEPRMLAATVVLMVQCSLIIYWTHRHIPVQGRARMLLIIGSSISLIGLGMRVVAVLGGGAAEMRYDVSNLKQTISVSIGTFTAMMISLGLVLLAKERSEALLQHMALRDVLTGILNRRAILDQFSRELERARRDGSSLAVAMVDIDHFKHINDRYGHLAGDEVIRHCANHLTQRIRHSDSIGRYGGEEFLILLPTTNTDGALGVLDELRASLAESSAQYGEAKISVRISIGVCCVVPNEGDAIANLLAKADAALYEAKASGRNTLKLVQSYPQQNEAPLIL
ncbi:diguanylate cyclase [Pseudomonas sp. PA-6-1D]|uniref:diguanylate cyclase n=3 Tax=Pseudomonas TaxID=286 RepID=A0A9Q3X894_PSESX|nr:MULTISPECIES: GGDEF domain-containing protein [unclassified Pseudomonas]MCF5064327.1 diguanylate cyclase [Pseudomonas syringae]MCF5072535.1 diguanylate cyclase [Pseudomonas syringae]MCF5116834.1 diguanylate cyclase [Pseudomonas syringae]MCF5142123.1 diguanylate cyclase [Pseudomonas sp. PA-6-3C]MCF5146843.1 diguanylate cyclase [Pseudomonas sp. PA-6-3F]